MTGRSVLSQEIDRQISLGLTRQEVDEMIAGTREYYPGITDEKIVEFMHHVEKCVGHSMEEHISKRPEIEAWFSGGIKLDKSERVASHKLLESERKQNLRFVAFQTSGPVQLFVVRHDWAAAFSGAGDYSGDFKLPYETICFEFRISGKHVCAIVGEIEGKIKIAPFIEWGERWEPFGKLGPFIESQVKAICVSLDAEIASTEKIEIPLKLNAARARRGKLPLSDYHIVELNGVRRTRSSASSGTSTNRTVRLHFRRGHWRLLGERKTWVRWCLVGNPDLGFIDKEYRL